MSGRATVLGLAGVAVAGVGYCLWQAWLNAGAVATVTDLIIYPVKSCAGTSLKTIKLDRFGVVGDRNFMIVDNSGSFQTQRQIPTMCQIKPTLRGSNELLLEAPNQAPLIVDTKKFGDVIHARIWSSHVEVVEMDSAASAWFSATLGKDVTFVAMDSSFHRPLDEKEFVPESMLNRHVNFADGYPLLLASEQSLREINRLIGGMAPLPMNRFRPNITVDGPKLRPFEEDTWRRIRIGNSEFLCVKPCSRCKIPSTDQTTGMVGTEPTNTLQKHRKVKVPGTLHGEVLFGINLVHVRTCGSVSVGGKLVVLETQASLLDSPMASD